MAKVLLVDDEEDIREGFARFLGKNGMEVVQAENGQQGLELTATSQFDLIVSDVRMPVMTGVEFLQEFRNRNPDTPFVLCTGYSDTPEQECLKAGANRVLKKPVKRKILLEEIQQLLKG